MYTSQELRDIAARAISAKNYGLAAEWEVVAPGDPEGFLSFQAALHEHYAPRDAMETFLVERIVACFWRLRRVASMENRILNHDHFGDLEIGLEDLMRYEKNLDRSLHQSIAALKDHRRHSGPKVESKPKPPSVDLGARN